MEQFRRSHNRLRTVVKNFPRYLYELSNTRSVADLYLYFYYKLPGLFPLCIFPPRINLELTNDCNRCCAHCHRLISNHERQIGYMEKLHVLKVIEEIRKYKGTVLKLIGHGEPSLHKDIVEFMRMCTLYNLNVWLYTNGTLFNTLPPEIISEWKSCQLIVSIDGYDENSYRKIRNSDQWRHLHQTLGMLRRMRKGKRPGIWINHVVFKEDTDLQIKGFLSFWKSVSDAIDFSPCVSMYPNSKQTNASFKPKGGCVRIRRDLTVLWNGDIPVCGPQFRFGGWHIIGNISDSSILSLWEHPDLQRLRKVHGLSDLGDYQMCIECLKNC